MLMYHQRNKNLKRYNKHLILNHKMDCPMDGFEFEIVSKIIFVDYVGYMFHCTGCNEDRNVRLEQTISCLIYTMYNVKFYI